jgi:hypothetical protein
MKLKKTFFRKFFFLALLTGFLLSGLIVIGSFYKVKAAPMPKGINLLYPDEGEELYSDELYFSYNINLTEELNKCELWLGKDGEDKELKDTMETEERLSNGGFEGSSVLGAPEDWILDGILVEDFSSSSDHVPTISEDAYNGSYALQFKAEDGFLSSIRGGISLDNVSDYDLEFYSKGIGHLYAGYGDYDSGVFWNVLDEKWEIEVANPFATDAEGNFFYLHQIEINNSSSYEKYTIDSSVTGEGFEVDLMVLSMDDAQALIDNISVKKSGEETNILSNSSFEDRQEIPENWIFDNQGGEILELEDNPDDVYSGDYSVKIGGDSAFSPESISDFSGKFDLSFQAKSQEETDSIYIFLNAGNCDPYTYSYDFDKNKWYRDWTCGNDEPEEISISNDWSLNEKKGISFPDAGNLSLSFGETNNNVWIDEVSIMELIDGDKVFPYNGNDLENGDYDWNVRCYYSGDSAEEELSEDFSFSFLGDPFCGGSGIEGDPYLICNPANLDNIRRKLSAYYRLNNDIDLDVSSYNEGSGWTPIGESGEYEDYFLGDFDYFLGDFDGNSHVIKNLFIDNQELEGAGLFKGLDGASIYDLGLTDVSIRASSTVGALSAVAENNSNLNNIYVQGDVVAENDEAGSLVGSLGGESIINNSYSDGKVEALFTVGGLAGALYTGSSISDSYSSSEIRGSNFVGGLSGFLVQDSSISNSFFTGNLDLIESEGDIFIGGIGGLVNKKILIGEDEQEDNSEIIDSYWLQGSSFDACYAESYLNIIGEEEFDILFQDYNNSGCEMKDDSNYFYNYSNSPMKSWDFDSVWDNVLDGSSYPILQWQGIESEVAEEDEAITRGGAVPVLLPSGIGYGERSVASNKIGGSLNVGDIGAGGVNVLTYQGNVNNFNIPQSSHPEVIDNYSFQIIDLDLLNNIVTILIQPESMIVNLEKGESREIDLDRDGINDFKISFVDVYVNRAEITVEPITLEKIDDKEGVRENVIQREKARALNIDQILIDRLAGRILLQVEESGEAWYLEPQSKKKHYLGRPADAFSMMRDFGLGISEDDFFNFQEDGVPVHFSGKILLRTENNGEAYYVNPVDREANYLGRPDDAFKIMRELSLGVSNDNLRKIPLFD